MPRTEPPNKQDQTKKNGDRVAVLGGTEPDCEFTGCCVVT